MFVLESISTPSVSHYGAVHSLRLLSLCQQVSRSCSSKGSNNVDALNSLCTEQNTMILGSCHRSSATSHTMTQGPCIVRSLVSLSINKSHACSHGNINTCAIDVESKVSWRGSRKGWDRKVWHKESMLAVRLSAIDTVGLARDCHVEESCSALHRFERMFEYCRRCTAF